ncbi:MAG TPA: CapA family protein, partial [Candidatus Limnocylindria bacterium]|nr:CapA family protein [Candidatus Limnocylindria bacterium]
DGSGAAVRRALTAPITVVDVGPVQHQKIYARPDPGSPVLGAVHGQTAGVEVLEADAGGFALVRAARHGDGAWVTGYVPAGKLKVAYPDARYGVVIDKAAQTLSVYRDGSLLGAVPVSTGAYVPPGDTSMDTVPGAFLTGDRVAEFSSEGFRYAHGVRIDGGNLIHQLGYRLRGGMQDFTAQRATLGQAVSHGCVRADDRVSVDGINAWWLYANLPRGTKVLVLPGDGGNDADPDAPAPGVPGPDGWAGKAGAAPGLVTTVADAVLPVPGTGYESTSFQVRGETGLEDAPLLAEPSGRAPGAPDTVITLTFGGDCVLGGEDRRRGSESSFDAYVAREGMGWPFSGLSSLFAGDDLTQVNLEGVLMDGAQGLVPRLHNFRGPAAFAGILAEGSVELVNVANNHFPDYGQAGKDATRAALAAAGVAYSGYGTLHVYEKDGFKVGFGGIRETVFHQGRDRVRDEVEALRAMGCGFVVYHMHAGEEYAPSPTQAQRDIAWAALDAGADLVIGHHPHVVQGVERAGGGLVCYSLGNLTFGGNPDLEVFDGLVVRASLGVTGGRLVSWEARLVPVLTSGARPGNDYRPVVAEGADKARILDALNAAGGTSWGEVIRMPAPRRAD